MEILQCRVKVWVVFRTRTLFTGVLKDVQVIDGGANTICCYVPGGRSQGFASKVYLHVIHDFNAARWMGCSFDISPIN